MCTRPLTFCLLASALFASTSTASGTPKRVQPPEWSQDVLDAFFDDAREHLSGPRPSSSARVRQEVTTQPSEGIAEQGEFKWSRLVDAETLTAEVKRLNNQLATTLKKSAGFQGGGNLACRRDFGLLSMLFGVIAEFDGDVRWQQSAGALRERCLKTSRNCKVASTQTFADAKETRVMLDELMRGQAPAGETASDGVGELVDRTLLMQAMELAVKERLSPALSNSREFRRRSQQAAEQAQVLAILAEIMQREGYEYSDDDEFLDEARQLRAASAELSQAAKDKNYEAARAAAGRVSQSCSRCHEGYRG